MVMPWVCIVPKLPVIGLRAQIAETLDLTDANARRRLKAVGSPLAVAPSPAPTEERRRGRGNGRIANSRAIFDLGREQPPKEIDESVAYFGDTVWFRAGGLGRIITILAVPCIGVYGFGPNDFAQSLGYPGQPDQAEVVRTMQEITHRIQQAGDMVQRDVMEGAWVSDLLLGAGRRILSP